MIKTPQLQASADSTAAIERYYNRFNEEHRLTTRHGQVEFTTTMHYIHRALSALNAARAADAATALSDAAPEAKNTSAHFSAPLAIADIGAGTGRYSVALSREGHSVTAVELVARNLAVLEAKHEKVNCWPGDARDLHFLADDSFDLTLLLGPLYHLHTHTERLQALSEAKRITRRGGYIFAAYVMNEYSVLTYCFRQGHIKECMAQGLLTEDFHTVPDADALYSYLRLEDIDALNRASGLERIKIVAADSSADYLRRDLNAMDEETFALYLRFHLATCERPELLGASSHTIDILRN